jgi:predicted NBD/HSP70 family sugar kinase
MYHEEKGLSLDGVQTFNRSVILSAIHRLGVCSRKEISLRTGLDQATVTRALTPLIENDVVEEIGFSKSGTRGRRSVNLRLSGRRFRVIAIRLKRLSFAVALFDLLGETVRSVDVLIPDGQAPAETFEQIARLVDDYSDHADGQILGIGVALPGPFLQSDERILLMTESPQWQAFDFVHELRNRYLSIPIFSSHDAKVAALAVWRDAAIELGAKVMLYVMLGQGVGSAIVINGQVFRGSHGFAGELGHTSIDMHGPRCKCGNRGCLELYTSTLALQRKVREGVREGRTTALSPQATFEEIMNAYQTNDPLAVAEIEILGEHLAQSLVSCINFINPDLVVLGEAAVGFGDRFLRIVRTKLAEMVLPSILEKITVRSYGVEGDIAMIGSCLSVFQETLLSKQRRPDV